MSRKWTINEWSRSPEETDIEIIWETDAGGGYDWEIVAIIAKPLDDGTYEYAVYNDAGCSCNYAYEMGPDSYDFAWTKDFREIGRQSRSWIDNMYSLDSAQKVDARVGATRALNEHTRTWL